MSATLSVSLIDSKNRVTKRKYGMETQVLLADYVTAATAFLTALGAVSDLGIEKANFLIPLTGVETSAVALSNIDTGGTFTGTLDTTVPRDASTKVPGIKDALVGGDGSIAITGDVATYLAEFETAGDMNLAQGHQISNWKRGVLDK